MIVGITPERGKFLPRMVLKKGKDGIITAVSLSFVFKPFPEKALEYVHLDEVDHLEGMARANGRIEGMKEALEIIRSPLVAFPGQTRQTLERTIEIAEKALAALPPQREGEETK